LVVAIGENVVVKKAIEDRADWIEIDVQETADGEVVVFHDNDFMRLAGVDLTILCPAVCIASRQPRTGLANRRGFLVQACPRTHAHTPQGA